MTEAISPGLLCRKRKFDSSASDSRDFESTNREKNKRIYEGNDKTYSVEIPHIDQTKFLESQILSLKLDYQMSMDRKESENQQLNATIQALREYSEKLLREKNVLVEENTLLKKAINLLDKKQKDSALQLNQFQTCLESATRHIQELERQNRNLAYHLSLVENSRSAFDPKPPPDVF